MISSLLLSLVLLLPQTQEEQIHYDKLYDGEQELFDLVNEERTSRGLVALTKSQTRQEGARRQALRQMNSHRMFHGSYFGRGENVAMGQPNPRSVMRAWMNSSGHRANILNPHHRHGGMAGFGSGTIYWCQQFE